MTQRILGAIPLALAWMPLTSNFSLEAFLVGMVVGVGVLSLLFSTKPHATTLTWRRVPDIAIASTIYFLILCRDIFLSAVEVARIVVAPTMPIKPGIIAVATQFKPTDENDHRADAVAAISAHGITITPGELTVDFDHQHIMYVHCLNVEASAQTIDAAQTKRLALIKRILT